jgi:hypothetical protein
MELEPLFMFDLPPVITTMPTAVPGGERTVSNEMAPFIQKNGYANLTSSFLGMDQRIVAGMVGLPHSTFSKRWLAASKGRVWPNRRIKKIDGEIQTARTPRLIQKLRRLRERLLKPVKVYIVKRKPFSQKM